MATDVKVAEKQRLQLIVPKTHNWQKTAQEKSLKFLREELKTLFLMAFLASSKQAAPAYLRHAIGADTINKRSGVRALDLQLRERRQVSDADSGHDGAYLPQHRRVPIGAPEARVVPGLVTRKCEPVRLLPT